MARSSRRLIIPAVASLLLIMGITTAWLFARTPAALAGGNLVTNPGFETGNLNGWSCDAGTTVVTSPVHSGSYAAQLNPTNSTTGQCTQTISVQPNTAYTLSGYVDGPYAYLGITGGSSTWTTSSSFAQLTVPFTTGAGVTSVTIYVHGWYAQASVGVDDVVLSGPGGSATATPGATATPTQVPTHTPTPGPTATPQPTATPCTGCGGSLPRHELTGYWQDYTNGATPLRLSDVPSAYDLIAVAFGDADPSHPGGVTFSLDSGLSSALGGYSTANFISDIQTLHSRGQKVILSIGGQNGNVDLSSASPNISNFVNETASLLTEYGFDGIDIDLESGINVANLTTALQQLQQRVGASFILTLAPQTLDVQPGGAYLQLINNIKSIITVVHTQYYNSGSMNGCDGNLYYEGTEDFETALACILLQTLRPDQVALGLPASTSAAGSGYVNPSVVNNALDCLARGTNCGGFHPSTTYPAIRGAMTYSINWDAANGYNFANTVKPHLATLP